MLKELLDLFASWNIPFKNSSLLEEALVHSSYVHEIRNSSGVLINSNERFEFLGDSVLGLLVSAELMKKAPKASEGELSRLKSIFVSEKSLSIRARDLDLGQFLKMGRGESLQGGQDRDSALADMLEALLAAVYLDQGLEVARVFCLKVMLPRLSLEGKEWENLEKTLLEKDAKSRLQELFQQNGLGTPRYVCLNEDSVSSQGPFMMALFLGDNEIDRMESTSKKEATQLLAQRLLAMDPEKLVGSLLEKGFMTSGLQSKNTSQ